MDYVTRDGNTGDLWLNKGDSKLHSFILRGLLLWVEMQLISADQRKKISLCFEKKLSFTRDRSQISKF